MEQATATADAPALSINLVVDDTMRSRMGQGRGLVSIAEAYEISSHEIAVLANEAMREAIAFKKRMQEMRKGFIQPAKDIIARAEALFDGPIQDAERAEGIYKQRLQTWDNQEKARVAAEQRAAEEAERKRRAEAEQRAAAERARAEERAREEKRKADEAAAAVARANAEAERIRREAEEARRKKAAEEAAEAARLRAAGDAAAAAEREKKAKAEAKEAKRKADAEAAEQSRVAATAAAEAARREENARAIQQQGEQRAQESVLAAAAAPAPVVEARKLEGFGQAANWVVELTAPTEADAIKLIAAALPDRPELIAMLKLDMTAARRQGTSLKAHFNIPGLKCTNQPKAVSRGAK